MLATLRIDPSAQGPAISPWLFGHFLENLGACLYRGGLLDATGKPREEIVRRMREMGVPILRWPGGLFADGYHWRDGVGPNRPVRPNKYWGRYGPLLGPKDPNHFGTHEFVALCRELGAEPYINVNLGSGTPREAADWVAYCNRTSGPEAERRAQNGAPAPLGVRVWGIGNETYGFWSIGHCDAKTYAARFREFHAAMTDADPSITPVAVGTCDLWPDWNPAVLGEVGERMSYLALHIYLPSMNNPLYLARPLGGGAANHGSLCAAGVEVARKIRFVAAQIREAGLAGRVRIALDEWNLWWWILQTYKTWWRMRDAVALAGMAGAIVDHAEVVGMANLAQAINVLGLIRTDASRVVVTPLWHVMRMFAAALRGARLAVTPIGPTFSTRKLGAIPPTGAIPTVEAWAARDGDNVGAVVAQRRWHGPVRVRVDAPGVRWTSIEILSAAHPDERNDFAHPDRVRALERPWDGDEIELPAACVARLAGVMEPPGPSS